MSGERTKTNAYAGSARQGNAPDSSKAKAEFMRNVLHKKRCPTCKLLYTGDKEYCNICGTKLEKK